MISNRRRHHLAPTMIAQIGKIMADAMEKVGKDGVITVEEGKGPRHRSIDVGGRHAVRSSGFLLAELRNQRRRDACRARRSRYILIYERQDQHRPPPRASAARARPQKAKQAAADHRGRHRRRSARDARGEQAAWRVERRRRQGARATAIAARRCLRTSRSVTGGHRDHRKTSASSWTRSRSSSSDRAKKIEHRRGQHRRSSKASAIRSRRSRAASAQIKQRNRASTTSDYDK